MRHKRDDKRLRDGLPITDGEGLIAVRMLPILGTNKESSVGCADGIENFCVDLLDARHVRGINGSLFYISDETFHA